MAVRKIPLKQRPYLTDSATEPNSFGARQAFSKERIDEKPPDPAVRKTLALIREKVLSDRVLHDQVSLVARIAIDNIRTSLGLEVTDTFSRPPPLAGRRGICLVYQGLF